MEGKQMIRTRGNEANGLKKRESRNNQLQCLLRVTVLPASSTVYLYIVYCYTVIINQAVQVAGEGYIMYKTITSTYLSIYLFHNTVLKKLDCYQPA